MREACQAFRNKTASWLSPRCVRTLMLLYMFVLHVNCRAVCVWPLCWDRWTFPSLWMPSTITLLHWWMKRWCSSEIYILWLFFYLFQKVAIIGIFICLWNIYLSLILWTKHNIHMLDRRSNSNKGGRDLGKVELLFFKYCHIATCVRIHYLA